ncbi:hypothetical protein C5F49_00365 [Nitrosopumilus oxyclinae]|uniref:Uncharacterized protein n=1 Tax=Nitrosopumilus oxyclinae TaxID=1959104 RepID=A0A7D5RD33_9ARCH|nr:hypothetical protein C5F49_00365 [Nitrosopumilus oxyclinae]
MITATSSSSAAPPLIVAPAALAVVAPSETVPVSNTFISFGPPARPMYSRICHATLLSGFVLSALVNVTVPATVRPASLEMYVVTSFAS